MKFSELSTDKALDVMLQMTPHIDNIVNDKDVVSAIGKVIDPQDAISKYGVFLIGVGRITEFIPILLSSHRNDVYGILSAASGKSAEEIAGQSFEKTKSQVKELLEDSGFMNFFKSFVQRVRNKQSAPSAPSPV